MTWLVHAGAAASTSSQFGGADTINKIGNLFNGVANVDTVDINSSFKFRSGKGQIGNPANTFNYTILGAPIGASRNLTLPLISADDSLVAKNSADVLKNKDLTDPSNTFAGSASIADGAVTTSKIADNAVTAAKIANGTITTSDIFGGAAIDYSKLNLAGQIVNADISASAAIAKTKLAALNIVNADVSATAAIAKSKLASLAIVDADISSTLSYSKLNLANSVASTDLQSTHPNHAAVFFPSKKRIGIMQSQATVAGFGTIGGTITADAKTGTGSILAITLTATDPIGVRWTTGTTAGSFGGWKVTGGTAAMPVQNCYISSRFQIHLTGAPGANNRFWLGFSSSNTSVPTGDEPLANFHGIMFGYRSTDSNWIICHNDGTSATSVFETGIMPAYDSNYHTIRLWTDDAGVHWKFQLDSGTITTLGTTRLPGTTTALFFWAGITNVDANSYGYKHAYTTFISDSI